jgi:hypothetical protein
LYSRDHRPTEANWQQEEPVDEVKPFNIPKREVWEAFKKVKKVKANQGAAGVDGQSIADFEADLTNNLYELWNRLSSGSYFPPPVRRVDIPKMDGGTRPLGIPTVADCIAQEVARRYLEPRLEPAFHAGSYGYRPGKSAIDAVRDDVILSRQGGLDVFDQHHLALGFVELDLPQHGQAVLFHPVGFLDRPRRAPLIDHAAHYEVLGGLVLSPAIAPTVRNTLGEIRLADLHFDQAVGGNDDMAALAPAGDGVKAHAAPDREGRLRLSHAKTPRKLSRLSLYHTNTKLAARGKTRQGCSFGTIFGELNQRKPPAQGERARGSISSGRTHSLSSASTFSVLPSRRSIVASRPSRFRGYMYI